jgi:GNAT superfamily N-acetyltransferase
MRLADRPYDDAAGDFERIWRFLVRDHQDRGGRFRWTIGRFADWKYNLATPRKYVPTFLADTCHLWFDGVGELAAWAIDENVDHDAFAFTKRGYGFLFGSVVDWIEAEWRTYARPCPGDEAHGELVIHLAAADEDEARQLRARGWLDIGRTSTSRRYDVAGLAHPQIALPDGFRLVTMAEDPNWASKERLHHNAWHHDEPVTALDLDLFAYSRTAPTYDPTLDISVVAPDGEHVASCIGFPDHENAFAEIERVCTRSDHRRRGLAAAAIQGCLDALDHAGIATAALTGYGDEAVRLYGKLDAIDTWEWHAWRRIVPLPAARVAVSVVAHAPSPSSATSRRR